MPVAVEAIACPLARRRKIEFVISVFAGYADKGFAAGVLPQVVGCRRGARRGNAQGIDRAGHAKFEVDVALRCTGGGSLDGEAFGINTGGVAMQRVKWHGQREKRHENRRYFNRFALGWGRLLE